MYIFWDLQICFRGVLWMQLTSRVRQRFTSQQRGVEWKCAGYYCREQGAGCSIRRIIAAWHHWSSANRAKHLGESAASRNMWHPPHKTRRMLHFILASFGTYEISSMFAFPDSIFLLGLWCWLLLCCIFSLDISNSPNYWVGTLMSQYTTSPESLMVHLALYMSSIHLFYNKNTKIIIAKQFMLQLWNWIFFLDVLCWMWSYKKVKGCFVFFFLNSFILLDTVFSIAEWSCHPADCSHVGRLWGFNLWFALPMACQKHFHTIPPHDHIPKVWQKL